MSRLERTLSPDHADRTRHATGRGSAFDAQADAAGQRGLQLTLSHYGELMRRNMRTLVLLTFLAAFFGGLYAVYKLNFSPVYRASAKVTVQPTDAELRFTQVYVRSSAFNSANVVTRSHIEYLNSYEIAARAYVILTQNGGSKEPIEEADLPGWIMQAKEAKRWLASTLKWLNSGTPIGASPEGSPEDVIAEIQDSISLQMIEASYVMQISVDWDDPQLAARIANTLASVYQERRREQAAAATSELTRFLDGQKTTTETRLQRLLAERNALREKTGVVDLEAQRRELLARLFREIEQRDAETRERNSIRAMLDVFFPENPGRRFDGISREMMEELNIKRMREVDLGQAIAERERIIAELQASIEALSPREAQFEAINSEIERTRTQLDDIDARLLNVKMNEASGGEPLRVIDTARAPIFPEEPKVLVQTTVSGMAGLLLGVFLILGRDVTSGTLRTNADLSDIPGCRVVGPVQLDADGPADRRKAKGSLNEIEARPFLSWYEFDTDDRVMVLDTQNEARAAAVGHRMLDHYPYSDNISCGLAPLVRHRGYLKDCAVVLITLGRDEAMADTIRELVQKIRSQCPDAAVGITFVDGRWDETGAAA